MGLDDFKTDEGNTSSTTQSKTKVARTKSADKESNQRNLFSEQVSKFTEHWGMTPSESMRDEKWISERLEEGWGVSEFCDTWNVTPNTVLEMMKGQVIKGYITLDDIPDADIEGFKKKECKWYVEQAIKHKQFPYVPQDNSIVARSDKIECPNEFKEGIGMATEKIPEGNESHSGIDSFLS